MNEIKEKKKKIRFTGCECQGFTTRWWSDLAAENKAQSLGSRAVTSQVLGGA